MKPIKEIPKVGYEANPGGEVVVYRGNTELGIENLQTLVGRAQNGLRYIASFWELTSEERTALLNLLQHEEFPVIELLVMTNNHQPPVALSLL